MRSILALLFLFAHSLFARERHWVLENHPTDHVNLEGVWSHTNLTPFERPLELQSFIIAKAEADAFKQRFDAKNEDLGKPAEPSEYFDDRHFEPIRGEYRSSIIFEPASGLIPGNDFFRERAALAKSTVLKAFDGPEQRPGAERCLSAPSAAPPIQLVPAGDLRQIVQTPVTIVIAAEELHEARIVRLHAPHAPASITSWLGDSIGWWEGNTLVVETTHFSEASAMRMSPNSLVIVSPKSIVIERFTRTAKDEIRYEFTVTDPTYYTQSWSGETLLRRSASKLIEYACHEGNYALPNILGSARTLESESD